MTIIFFLDFTDFKMITPINVFGDFTDLKMTSPINNW